MPNGVSVESLVGIGGWDPDELDIMRIHLNAQCLRSLPDFVAILENEIV